jgi:hypothetical protein
MFTIGTGIQIRLLLKKYLPPPHANRLQTAEYFTERESGITGDCKG